MIPLHNILKRQKYKDRTQISGCQQGIKGIADLQRAQETFWIDGNVLFDGGGGCMTIYNCQNYSNSKLKSNEFNVYKIFPQ